MSAKKTLIIGGGICTAEGHEVGELPTPRVGQPKVPKLKYTGQASCAQSFRDRARSRVRRCSWARTSRPA
jgi:hypothetical protein